METIIYDNNASKIVFELKNIYVKIVFDNDIYESLFIQDIVNIVNDNNSLFVKINKCPNVSYSIDFNKELFKDFVDKFTNQIEEICKTIYSFEVEIQSYLDLSAIVVPYILIKFNITNTEIALVFDLCVLLAKYFIDNIVRIQGEKHDCVTKKDLINICKANLQFLDEIKESDMEDDKKFKAIEDYKSNLIELINKIDK